MGVSYGSIKVKSFGQIASLNILYKNHSNKQAMSGRN